MSLLTSLVSTWDLDEASGTRADSHSTNDLTDNNTVGTLDGGADFEADNSEYLSRSDNAALSLGDEDFTIAFVLKPETLTGNPAPLGKDSGGATSNRSYGFYFVSGTLHFYVSGDGTDATVTDLVSTFGALSTGIKYTVIAEHQATGNKITLAINNGTADEAAHSTGVFDGTAEFRLGAINAASPLYFDGILYRVSIWRRLLTSGEKTTWYNGGAGLPYASFGITAIPILHNGKLLLVAP